MSFSSCAFRDSLEACGDGSLGRLQIYKGLLFVKIGAEGRLFTTENAADAAVFRLLRQGPAEIMLQEVTTGMVVSIDDYDDLNGQISLRSILEPSKQRLLVTVQELAEKVCRHS